MDDIDLLLLSSQKWREVGSRDWETRCAHKFRVKWDNRGPKLSSLTKMALHFLHDLPREIRDHIYSYVLASSSGSATLTPWTLETAISLSLLQTCHQIHRECKDLIWQHTGLSVSSKDRTQLYQKLQRMQVSRQMRSTRRIVLHLELLDRDELEWVAVSLRALRHLCGAGRLESITLATSWERPRNIHEFGEVLALRKHGELLDGRFVYASLKTATSLILRTGWPPFSHWGKQGGLKSILLDPRGTGELLEAIHEVFGGELYVDGILCFQNQRQVSTPNNLDHKNGNVRILPSAKYARERKNN